MHVLQLQPPAAGLCLAPCGLRLLQQRQHHSPRADPVHGHVEGASEGTERPDDEEGRFAGEVTNPFSALKAMINSDEEV